MSTKRPITPKGYNALREELKKLKGMRPQLAAAIEEARGHGDLSENADYDAAKEKSGMVESKIRDLEAKLSVAEIIDPRKYKDVDQVVFGVTVEIEDLDTGDTKKYTIVGEDESDVNSGLLSLATPMARALIGKRVGDFVEINLPAGKKEFEVVNIFVDYKE